MPEAQGKVPCCIKVLNYFLCHSNDPNYEKKTWGRKCIDCMKPAQDEPVTATPTGDEPAREKWGNRCEFFVSTLGMSVGLGSVWRFPTLTYKMGGAAFMIMYMFMVLTMSNALFFFEVSNGQYTSKGPLRVYDKVPFFQGVGIAMVFYSYLFCTYYAHMVSFSLYYLFSCFRDPLPWTYCPDELNDFEDSVSCFPASQDPTSQGLMCGNLPIILNLTALCTSESYLEEQKKLCCSAAGTKTDEECDSVMNTKKLCGEFEYPSAYYWSHTVVQQYREGDPMFGYLGNIRWPLALTSLLAWLICYFGLYKGLKSMGVMMYIIVPLPYIILIIMFIASITQEGASEGLKELFIPKFSSFMNIDVWRTATEQAFYSVGTAMGPIITFGSYSKFSSPSHIDGTLICLCICFTGLLCSLVVFSAMGYLAIKTGREFNKVVEAGPGLIFVVYPESLHLIPGSVFFSILFYLMLINLGSSSVMGIIETVSSACYDLWPSTRKYKYLVNAAVLGSAYLIGLSITARGGLSVYNAFDTYAAGMTLIPLCALELLLVIYIYGIGRFCEDISFMIGFYPNRYYRYQWLLGPMLLCVIFVYGFVQFEPPTEWRTWTFIVSWILFFMIIGNVPIVMIYQLVRFAKQKNVKGAFVPLPEHGPANPSDRANRPDYHVKRKIF